MSHHIKPLSVMQYISGIVNSFEPYFPDIQKHWNHILITCTLTGMKKLHGYMGTHHNWALTEEDLVLFLNTFISLDLENLVFLVNIYCHYMCSFSSAIQLNQIHLWKTHFERSLCVTLSSWHIPLSLSSYQLTKPTGSLRAQFWSICDLASCAPCSHLSSICHHVTTTSQCMHHCGSDQWARSPHTDGLSRS